MAHAWAKHLGAVGVAGAHSEALSIARYLDFGIEAENAAEQLRYWMRMRAMKVAA